MEPEPHKLPIRFYEIDLLRFLAALAVVMYHYTYRGYNADHYSPIAYPEFGRFTKYGFLGVELFFIISGYVVLLSAQGKTVRQFFLSRVTRLYPAFWVACTLTYATKLVWGTHAGDGLMSANLHAGPGQYVYNMTMLQEFLGIAHMDGAYWSLTVELTFYFLIAILISGQLMPRIDWFLAAWLAYAAIPGLPHIGALFPQLFFPTYAPYFVSGMLFYLLQQPQGRTRRRYGLMAVSYALSLQSGAKVTQGFADLFHDSFSNAIVLGAITGFFVLFYLITTRKIDLSRLTWLTVLGGLTYPLYLLHSDIGFIAFHRLGTSVNKYALLAGLLVLMLLLARCINVFVEKRFSKQLGQYTSSGLDYVSRLTAR